MIFIFVSITCVTLVCIRIAYQRTNGEKLGDYQRFRRTSQIGTKAQGNKC